MRCTTAPSVGAPGASSCPVVTRRASVAWRPAVRTIAGMDTQRPLPETRRLARCAGLLYTLVALIAPIGLFYVPGRLVVPGNAGETAARIVAHPGLLRLGMGTELFHQALEVWLVLVLFELFRPVGLRLSRQMLVLGLIPIPLVFLNVINELAALGLVLPGPSALAIDPGQRQSLALFFLHLHAQGLQLAEVFWGLWLFPLGLLAWRSGFMPRLIGACAIAGGTGYLLDAGLNLLAPSLADSLGSGVVALQLGEPVMILWLLIAGARVPRQVGGAQAPAPRVSTC